MRHGQPVLLRQTNCEVGQPVLLRQRNCEAVTACIAEAEEL